jgi:hypothetical protein
MYQLAAQRYEETLVALRKQVYDCQMREYALKSEEQEQLLRLFDMGFLDLETNLSELQGTDTFEECVQRLEDME